MPGRHQPGVLNSAGTRLLICSDNVPRLSVMIARATDWKSARSSVQSVPHGERKCLRADRRNGPRLAAISPRICSESLPIAIVILIPDHQIDGQTLEPPIGMRLDELAHQFRLPMLRSEARQSAGRRILRSPSSPDCRR